MRPTAQCQKSLPDSALCISPSILSLIERQKFFQCFILGPFDRRTAVFADAVEHLSVYDNETWSACDDITQIKFFVTRRALSQRCHLYSPNVQVVDAEHIN